MAACNNFVRNIQSEDSDIRCGEVSSFIEYLNGIVSDGRAPLHELGQGVCSNVLYLLITKHVQPMLSGKSVITRGRLNDQAVERLNDQVTTPFVTVVETIHCLLPQDYPMMPLLWKSSGAWRKVMEHILIVLESDSLVVKCGYVYCNLLRFLLRFEAYQDILSPNEVNRIVRRLLSVLGMYYSDASATLLLSAAAQLLSSVFSSSVSLQHLELKESAVRALCDVTTRFHDTGEAGVHPLQTDFKTQSFLVRSVRLVCHGLQSDDGTLCSSQANGLVKTLLSLWHRTAKRDEWRGEVIQFLTSQLSFMFSASLAGAKRSDFTGENSSSHLFLFHNEIVPLLTGIFFPSRRDQQYDGGGRLRHFPSPSMRHFIDLFSLTVFICSDTYRAFLSQVGTDGNFENTHGGISPFLVSVVDVLSQLATDLSAGHRLSELKDSILLILHGLGNPLTSFAMEPLFAEGIATRLLSCYPSSSPVLNFGLLSALSPLWRLVTTPTLFSAWSSIAPALFPSRNLCSQSFPSEEGCSSALFILRSLLSKGIFLLPRVEGFELSKCALLNTSPTERDAPSEFSIFRPYVAEFFVECLHFTVDIPDKAGEPLLDPLSVAHYLAHGYSGIAGVSTLWQTFPNGKDSNNTARGAQSLSLYKLSAEYVADGGVSENFCVFQWPSRSQGSVVTRVFDCPQHFGFVLPNPTHLSPLISFCDYESARTNLQSLGKGSAGIRARLAFEKSVSRRATSLLCPWHLDGQNGAVRYGYGIPQEVHDATCVHRIFERNGNAIPTVSHLPLVSGSSALAQSLFQWSQAFFEELELARDRQIGFQDARTGPDGLFSPANMQNRLPELRVFVKDLSFSIIRSITVLRTLLLFRRLGVWATSIDEDDARVLMERSFASPSHRAECYQRLTPHGGLGLVTLLLLRFIDSQLRIVDVRCLLSMGNPQSVAYVMECIELIIAGLQLLCVDTGEELCSSTFLLWDPRRLSFAALQGVCSWVATTFGTLLSLAGDREFNRTMLAPSTRKGIRSRILSGTDSSRIGSASASVTESERTTQYPVLQSTIRCVDRLSAAMRILHAESLKQLGSSATTVQLESAFVSTLFDENEILNIIFRVFYTSGLVPNAENTNPAARIEVGTNPFRGTQFPPIALLEMVDSIAAFVTSFSSASSDKVFAILHDAIFVIRCLYADSHLGTVIRLVEAMCGERSNISKSEWGATILRDILAPREASAVVVRFISSSVFSDCSNISICPSTLAMDLSIPPPRWDFVVTDRHRSEICRSQATAMLRCQGKRWGVAVGRSLFAACSTDSSFRVRLQAASYISLPFKLYQRNLGGVLAELLEQVRSPDGYLERSRCATSLLAVSNACAFAPTIEGDIVSFMLEVYATRGFLHKRMLLDALEHLYRHRPRDAVGKNVVDGASAVLADTLRTESLPTYCQVTRAHIGRAGFDWIWSHGHPLLSFPFQCFGYATIDAFIIDNVRHILPLSIIAMHKTRSLPSDGMPDAGLCDQADSSAMDAVNNVMRAHSNTSSLITDNFAAVVSFLLLLARCEDDGGTRAPPGQSLKDFRATAEKALSWVRLQLGSELFVSLCRRHTESIIVESLTRCRDTAPQLPFFSFKVLCNGISYFCEIIGVPSFASLMTAHNGDRAYIVLSSVYSRLCSVSADEALDTMMVFQGLLTGICGQPCLRIPVVLEVSLRILCYTIRSFSKLRPMACECLRSVWASVAELKDGHSLLRPHLQLLNSFLSTLGRDSTDVAQCIAIVSSTFSSENAQAPEAVEGSSGAFRRTESATFFPRGYEAFGCAEPSQMPSDTDCSSASIGQKRCRDNPSDARAKVALSPAGALYSVASLPSVLSRLGTAPDSLFRSVAAAVDAQDLFLRNAIIEEVLAKEMAMRHSGVSPALVRSEQLTVARRIQGQLGVDLSAFSSAGEDVTITEVFQRSARHVFFSCVRSESSLSSRTAALEALRAIVGCLVEGCAGEAISAIDFAPSSTAMLEVLEGESKKAQNDDPITSWSRVNFSSHTLEDNVYHLYCRLLTRVRSLAVDADPSVMAVSASVLRAVCADVVGSDSILSASMALLRDSYPSEYAKIKPFRRECQGDVSRENFTDGWRSDSVVGLGQLVTSFPGVPEQSLWDTARSQPDLFIRSLTTALLKDHVVPHFPSLAPFIGLVAVHGIFAEIYLPLVFLHISMRRGTDEKERLRRFLATNIDAVLRCNEVPLRVSRLLLNCINFLRGARTSVIKHFGLHDAGAYGQNTAATDDEKRRERSAKEIRHEFERLNRTSLIGHRDRITSLSDTLWFPPENLPLATLVGACARCDEWGLCLLISEMCFDGIDDTPGLMATILYSVGSDNIFSKDGALPATGVSTGHSTRKAARAQRLQQRVRAVHESVGSVLLQCAERLRDGGMLKQLLFTHKSLLTGGPSDGSQGAQIKRLSLALSRQRTLLLNNVSVSMQSDENGRGTARTSHRRRECSAPDNAVRVPKHISSLVPSMECAGFAPGATTADLLRRMGCPHASYSVALTSNLPEAASEAAWRCGEWDLSLVYRNQRATDVSSLDRNIHRSIHAALCHAAAFDTAFVSSSVVEGQEAIVGALTAFNVVDSVVLSQGLREIQLFSRIARDSKGCVTSPPLWLSLADYKSDIISGRSQERETFRRLRGVCEQFSDLLPSFRVVEPLAAVRAALCQMGVPDEWVGGFLAATARDATSGGYPYTALQWVNSFVQRCHAPTALNDHAFSVGRSLLLHATGDTDSALQVLADCPNMSSSNEVLALLGAWTARSQRIPLHKLVREPLMRQMTMDGPAYNEPNMYLFASWCDILMREVKESLSSKNAVSTIENYRTLAARASEGSVRDKAFDSIRKEITAANSLLQTLQGDLDIYCDTTIIGYASCLASSGASGDANDLHAIYRILHHWLGESASVFSATAQERIALIPPIKFLPVFPQLVVRVITVAEQQRIAESVSPSAAESYELIRKVVISCLELYPTHCLWYVFSLRHSTDASKAEAAAELIAHVAGLRHLKALVLQMATMVDGYVQQGGAPKEKEAQSEGATIPSLQEAAARCPSVPVPTVPTRLVPFNLTAGASALAPHPNGYHAIGNTYKVLGGISKPRLITITMVSGQKARQIVKGNDDLRQDAVIQQVFSLSCTLLGMRRGGTGVVAAAGLRGDPLASLPVQGRGGASCGTGGLSGWVDQQRRLYMRTYAVVPLGPGCGLIQFLDSAMSLAEYLADEVSGAHRRYFPRELTSNQCRAMMSRNRGQTLTASGKSVQAAFEEVCEGFSPAMHYFYYEHFASSKHWMEARGSYVTSSAVSSIVGFVVGLGDRHASNVMVDRQSAEIVHIDLGISFDQGQLLPIPEEVPFRLTRDMVDGMGIFGVEGNFRGICEQTLATMRENRQLLTAVVETFVYDPLARWSIDVGVDAAEEAASQVSKMRNRATKSTPLKAHSVLRKTEDKLRGLEAGEILGVPNQVQTLLQRATDPDNLCRMFQGWSAWL